MVIRYTRPGQIMLSLWGDMHDLSQILHIPGKYSIIEALEPIPLFVKGSCTPIIEAPCLTEQTGHAYLYLAM